MCNYYTICLSVHLPTYLSVLIFQLITVLSLINVSPASWDDYVFPNNIQVLGWLMTSASIFWVLIGAAFAIISNKEGFRALFRVTPDFCPESQRKKLVEDTAPTFRYTYSNEMCMLDTASSAP